MNESSDSSDGKSVSHSEVSSIAVKVHPFWRENPTIWFSQLESQFITSGIVQDSTKYHTVVASVEPKFFHRSYLFVALTCAIVALSVSYPTGAPKETCVTFSANHTGQQPQSSRPNFELTVSPSNAAPGSTLTVTLQGKGGDVFKGFFIQGQNSAGQPVGKFTPQSDAQTRDCSAADDSVTHVSANEKTKVTLKWQAPASYTGKVVFRAVVVKTYERFWNNILSNSLNIA